MPAAYVNTVAKMAYIWDSTMFNQFNRREGITRAPFPMLDGGIVPVAPRGQLAMLTDYVNPMETFVTCQDVV